jgi:hypothetical protein
VSDSERPDLAAFGELEVLIRSLGEEMARWRRRALQAESQLKAAAAAAPAGRAPVDPRVAELQRENAELRARLDIVGERTRRLLDRMRFLRQQHELEVRR